MAHLNGVAVRHMRPEARLLVSIRILNSNGIVQLEQLVGALVWFIRWASP